MHNDELSFLDSIFGSRAEQYKSCPWLISNFSDNIWYFSFGERKLCVDYSIKMRDGSLLTSLKHRATLITIKYWILANIHCDSSKGIRHAPSTSNDRTIAVLQLIDYFILYDSDFNNYGFASLSDNKFTELFHKISKSKYIAVSLYDYNERVSSYLKLKVLNTNPELLKQVIQSSSHNLVNISESQIELNKLNISLEMVPFVRAWLLVNGLYRKSHARDSYNLSVNISKLSRIIFKNTLRGKSINQISLLMLSADEKEASVREMGMVAVRGDAEDKIGETKLELYRSVLSSLELLNSTDFHSEVGQSIPQNIIQGIDFSNIEFNVSKRFKTLPYSVVFMSMRSAIEFHIEYGQKIFDSYEKLVEMIHLNNTPLDCSFSDSGFTNASFLDAMDPLLIKIGIKHFSISKNRMDDKSNSSYFNALRGNVGLSELMKVYIGATQIVTGALGARRQSELISLVCNDCIDSTNENFIFEKSKI